MAHTEIQRRAGIVSTYFFFLHRLIVILCLASRHVRKHFPFGSFDLFIRIGLVFMSVSFWMSTADSERLQEHLSSAKDGGWLR